VSLLQSCNKIMLEPSRGLIKNGLKILNSTPKEQENVIKGQFRDVYKKMMFVITFYHAVLNERAAYNSMGWNKSYDFAFSDN